MPRSSSDPTYVKATIYADPVWRLAWWMSEIDNDNAPIGWYRYAPLARALLDKYTLTDKDVESPAAGPRDELLAALEGLVRDANRLCDRQLGGTYEEDCRRAIAVARDAIAGVR